MTDIKAFVIHPDRLKERGEHIDQMLHGIGMDYEFINEGHDEHQVKAYIDRYLRDGKEPMRQRVPRSLCTISHFLVYERIVADGLEGAVVFEDDIVLHSNFMPRFQQSISEYRQRFADESVLISYEDSSLRFVPRSQRREGLMLYPAKKGRMSGAYYINRIGAQAILDELRRERCDEGIDWYHNQLFDKGIVHCLWCQPALATQGSFTGEFHSSLTNKKYTAATMKWWMKRSYKRLLYWFR
jgi:glycosyl transferase family 25